MEKSELLSGLEEETSWMSLNQPVASEPLAQYPKDEDAEAFISGTIFNFIPESIAPC